MEKMFAQAEPAKTEPLNDALIMPDLVYAVDLRAISPTVSTRIQMTKEVRAMTQLGLKEAKDFVDHLVGNPQQWFTSSELARVPGERLRRAAMPRDFEGKVTKVS
jgi:ribosomal protein L7/L12